MHNAPKNKGITKNLPKPSDGLIVTWALIALERFYLQLINPIVYTFGKNTVINTHYRYQLNLL